MPSHLQSVSSLGVDIGTTNMKVVLLEIGERVMVHASAARPTPEPSTLGRALAGLLRRVLADQPPPQAVGIASMAETGVPIDASDTPIGGWLRWDGERVGDEAEQLARGLGWAELVTATGVRPSAKVPMATWAWLRRRHPEIKAAMTGWAGVADLTCLLLTGRLATDHTLAGRTMAYRLPCSDGTVPDGFDADLLAEVGLAPAQLPAVVTSGVAGTVRGAGFVDAGLRAGTPVVVAGHDHAVGAYAAGVRHPGQVADSVGTAEALLSITDAPPAPVAVARAGMSSMVTVDRSARAVLAGSPGAGSLVGWWLDHELAGLPAETVFDDVLALGDEPDGMAVLPYPRGRQAPAPDPSATLRVVGRRVGASPAELAGALLTGLCLHARWILEEQARLASIRPETVTVLGWPLVGNPAWLRRKAVTTPWPLRVVPEPAAVAAGAALVAAVRAGLVSPISAVLDTRPASAAPRQEYDRPFADFLAAATGPAHR